MTKKLNYVCKYCGSDNLVFDGVCEWNVAKQEYELLDIYSQKPYCGACENEAGAVEVELEEAPT